MRFSEAYRRLRESLSSVCGDFSDYEARRILENLTGCDAQGFAQRLTRPQPLEPDVIGRMEEILSRRTAREPLEYILGTTIFATPLYWGVIENTPPDRRKQMKRFFE